MAIERRIRGMGSSVGEWTVGFGLFVIFTSAATRPSDLGRRSAALPMANGRLNVARCARGREDQVPTGLRPTEHPNGGRSSLSLSNSSKTELQQPFSRRETGRYHVTGILSKH